MDNIEIEKEVEKDILVYSDDDSDINLFRGIKESKGRKSPYETLEYAFNSL